MPATLVIAGGGRMGGALVAGLVRAGWAEPGQLAVVEPEADRRGALAAAHPGLVVVEDLGAPALRDAAGAVIAVKPALALDVARALEALGIRRLLSIVAGVSTRRLEEGLSQEVAVLRAMPNMGALVGASASVVAAGSRAGEADVRWAEGILASTGFVMALEESQLDAVTGVSGSGPAYVFLVAEALAEGGVAAGLAPDVAKRLVRETLQGVAALLAEGAEPEDLRAAITSPGGTTAAALEVMERAGVRDALVRAVVAAADRSRELDV
jgi:pyrroline-5-carboxylate reductase